MPHQMQSRKEKIWKCSVADDQRYDVFKIITRMFKTNQGIIDEQYIRNDDGVLAFSDEDKNSLEELSWEAFEHRVCIGK